MDYKAFISTVRKNQNVWLLSISEGAYAMNEDNSGQEYIPVWPDKKSALSYISGEWEDYHAENMSLNEFWDWLEELEQDKIKLALPSSDGELLIPVSAKNLKTDLAD